MNRIQKAFSNGKVFIPFITGGDPDTDTTEKLLYTLTEAGADIIEIGVPFSDPVADGPVIELAHDRALKAGCTVEKLLELVKKVRKDIETPIVFMTYYNPVFAYGVENFTKRCKDCGVDGLIVPDLPIEERDELLKPCVKQDIELISLIAPSSKDRIEHIAKNSGGFLYCVSSPGVTGERDKIESGVEDMIKAAKKVKDIPCAVGFGISTPEQAKDIASFADGIIVGSAIVKLIAEYKSACVKKVFDFAKSIKTALTARV